MKKRLLLLISVFLLLLISSFLLDSCVTDFFDSKGSCRYGVLGSKCDNTTEDKCNDLGGIWVEDGKCH